MKTIFISSFHQFISRNILQTKILDLLLEAPERRVVIFIPDYKRDYYEREFGRDRIIIVGVPVDASIRTRRGFFFKRLARAMLGIAHARITRREQQPGVIKKILYIIFFYAPAAVLGKFRIMRQAMRWLDYHFVSDLRFVSYFEHYQPALVFSTDVQNEHDVALMREARHQGVSIVGMVRSWDNLTVHGLFRILPDRLVVANEILKRDVIKLDDMDVRDISVVGIPHYDRYLGGPTMGRDEFLRSIGVDPSRKLILYAPIGDMYLNRNTVDRDIITILASYGLTVLVRLPPAGAVDLEGFVPPASVILYQPGVSFRQHEYGDREISRNDDEHLINELSFCNLVVSGPSTMAVDAALFDKPIVLVGFDGREKRPYRQSVLRYYYDYPHMRSVAESRGVKLVKSETELKAAVSRYLADPALDRAGRRGIVEEQCWRLDGHSSERLVAALESFLGERR